MDLAHRAELDVLLEARMVDIAQGAFEVVGDQLDEVLAGQGLKCFRGHRCPVRSGEGRVTQTYCPRSRIDTMLPWPTPPQPPGSPVARPGRVTWPRPSASS